MKIEITKSQYAVLINGYAKTEDAANMLGIAVDVVKDWELNDMDYLLARKYFVSLHIGQANNTNCARLLKDIRENIVITSES